MQKNKYAVLLAGGQGRRFWPQSRTLEPKQFLSLFKESLFEQTVRRIKNLIPAENIFIVTSELYRAQMHEFMHAFNIPSNNIIFEPQPKNTAPSITAAMQLICRLDADALVCVLPCDHSIKNNAVFKRLLNKAFSLCRDNLIIFGIKPYRPATGYGYIKIRRTRDEGRRKSIYAVDKFTEKPDLKTAEKFVKDGRYFWNGGIFVGSCRKFLGEIREYQPHLYRQILKINAPKDINLVWKPIKPISFDYAVLEKAKGLLMLAARGLGWSDLGSWRAWDELIRENKKKNIFRGDVIDLGSRNITVLGNKRLIATIGLENLIIVDTPDALLITNKERSEDVKKVVELLKQNKRQEHYLHRTVKRQWGSYTVLDTGDGFKIKLMEVKPGCALSLQYHNRRSEHWVVVEGRAKIIKGKKTYFVNANESLFIPIKCVHRIFNPASSALKIVEVQTGDYLEEDDIIRLKDDFDRVVNGQLQ